MPTTRRWVLALAGITQNLGQSAFVIYTGDLLGHNFPVLFKQCNGGVQNEAAMKAFADKTVDFLLGQIRAAVGSLPVMFVVGNADSYLGALPEPSFLANNAELYYTKFLNGSADHQAFLDSFTRGGYYAAQPPGKNLTVVGLNTVLFGFASTESEVQAELSWLDSILASAQAAGRKVWLLMHVPPGAVLGTTATTAGNVSGNGHITTATMMWTAGRYERFIAVLDKYPGLITMTLAAHTHMDEYRVLSPGNVLEITPAISPSLRQQPGLQSLQYCQRYSESNRLPGFQLQPRGAAGAVQWLLPLFGSVFHAGFPQCQLVRASSAAGQQWRETGALPRQLLFWKQRLEPDYQHQLADLLERDRGDG